jgi:hypothetical protein
MIQVRIGTEPVKLSSLEIADMTVVTGSAPMAKAKKEKSETRRHTAMMRVDAEALRIARKAASLLEMSVADYVSDMIKKYGTKDLAREAKKVSGGDEQ